MERGGPEKIGLIPAVRLQIPPFEPKMDYLDFLKELRKGEPDPKKAEKAMRILGWICILGAIWNLVMEYLGPFGKGPFNLPPFHVYLALIGLSLLGMLFFRSARGIKERVLWGKRSGQLALVLLIAIIVGSSFLVFPMERIPLGSGKLPIIFLIIFAVIIAQFGVPAYFGIRYLGRLQVKDSIYTGDGVKYQNMSEVFGEEIGRKSIAPQIKYKDALLPFGVIGTFASIIGIPLLIIFILEKYFGPKVFPSIFLPTFLLIFFGPVVYNYIPAPFQKERSVVASYTGGGSILLFGGTWPFFRLMVYGDGIEVHTMFHRFFIPYDKMGDIPDKIGFFSRGVLIRTDLPGVPSGIRFNAFGMKKIHKVAE